MIIRGRGVLIFYCGFNSTSAKARLQKQEKVMNQIEDYIDLVMEASEYRNQEAFKKGFGMALSMVLEAVKVANK